MIVKNESKVLPRLFKSVAPYIDYYVISDTGSTDGTQDLINQLGKEYNIPGEVVEHDWVNFGHNRQLALDAAMAANKTDFLLLIDADEEFVATDTKFFEKLDTKYSYEIQKHHGDTRYYLPALINVRNSSWSWHAPVHNYIRCDKAIESKQISDCHIIYHPGQGAKSAGLTVKEKYLKDAAILEKEVVKNPYDTRSWFYLAQSYLDSGDYAKAYEKYQRVLELNGWIEEKYVAAWRLGQLAISLKQPFFVVTGWFLTAQALLPKRLEAIYCLLKYLEQYKMFSLGYQLGAGFSNNSECEKFRLYTIPSIYKQLFKEQLEFFKRAM